MSKFKLTQTAAEVQGILNGLESDGKGNLTVNKDLEVDGKLTLKSLVSASNPDGDITKELGGGSSGGGSGSARHCYAVSVLDFIYIVNTQKNYNFTIGKSILVSSSDFITNPDYAELHAGGESFNDKRCYPAIGTYKGSESGKWIVRLLRLQNDHQGYVRGTNLDPSITWGETSIDLSTIPQSFSIIQLY